MACLAGEAAQTPFLNCVTSEYIFYNEKRKHVLMDAQLQPTSLMHARLSLRSIILNSFVA
jgi:hypothetical protein